ncbi:MAG TPA: bifunctional phosphoribosylaminoimidazolecarboxamide formyltransferase/IMP cyclohydrolase [Gemmatimonadota bacterium]|nr:bifunctional phosphoribosylaminoimidazolecarboxamide formyltransferase/IMP cyclohydrolase [Gemmatimonadota bacterium]
MTRFAIFASGRGSNLESLFERLADHPDVEIALVLADREAEALERARERDVPATVVAPEKANSLLALLAEHEIDWIVLAGYLRKVPASVVQAYRNRILNIHPALLPRYGGEGMYGERVHRAVLEAGDPESGATVHLVDEEYDRGPIVAQRKVPVEPGDTPERLAERVLAVEHELLPSVVAAAAEGRIQVADDRAWIEDQRPLRPRRALLSVWDKRGLDELAGALTGHGIELVASGGTARLLEQAGLSVRRVEEVTGAPEFLEGRVKTLHPSIHGAILARRDRESDRRALEERGIEPIDLVVVNLYPFSDAVALGASDPEARTELIDIGGVALIRAAAKNWRDVAVVTDPADYAELLEELAVGGTIGEPTRRRLATRAFQLTAWYDARIAAWLSEGVEGWPERWAIGLDRIGELRYGENPHQAAALYKDRDPRPEDLTAVDVLQGKELSYNNYMDAEAARRLVRDLRAVDPESAHCVIVKHTIPCGAASADTALEAYERALAADPVSAFGGIVALDRPVDRELAERLAGHFLEVVWAPEFDPSAREVLAGRKNLRLLEGPVPVADPSAFELRRVGGGILVQSANLRIVPDDPAALQVATEAAPTTGQQADLLFAWTVCRAVASNAIVLARDRTTVGVGGGQTNRVGAVELAIRTARELGHDPSGAVLASDGFFPFPDAVEAARAAGITAIIQPGGSIRDSEVVEAADRAGIPMLLTGMRQFRH